MSECIVPNWKLNQQRQEVAAGEETNAIRTSHNHPLLPPPPPPPPPAAPYVVPMSNYEVATELTWENGQVAMHGLTGILPFSSLPAANKVPTFVRTGDTLESIVHQATHYKSSTPNQLHHHQHQQQQQQDNVVVTGKNADGNMEISKKKRPRTTSESDHHEYMLMKFHGNIINNNSSSSTKNIVHEDQVVANNNNSSGGGGGGGGAGRERSACASASATFCRDAATTTMMTWNSFESPPRSFKTSKTTDEDSACHDGASENRDEEDAETTKDETYRSHSARRSRSAIVHNQSERRRRDRINEKMKALQKLVPNASKTDKASMLDEVIEYLKQLQTQVHMLSTTTRSAIPQIMINHPLAIQQQQQQQQQQQISSLLARMGMGVGLGMGMGMLDMNTLAAAARSAPFLQQHHGLIPTATTITPTFVPPHFFVPAAAVHASQPNKSPADTAAGVPFSDPYSVYLAQVCQQKLSALNIKQTMNMEFYNKMAALYRQQATNQATQTTSNSSQPTFIQRE